MRPTTDRHSKCVIHQVASPPRALSLIKGVVADLYFEEAPLGREAPEFRDAPAVLYDPLLGLGGYFRAGAQGVGLAGDEAEAGVAQLAGDLVQFGQPPEPHLGSQREKWGGRVFSRLDDLLGGGAQGGGDREEAFGFERHQLAPASLVLGEIANRTVGEQLHLPLVAAVGERQAGIGAHAYGDLVGDQVEVEIGCGPVGPCLADTPLVLFLDGDETGEEVLGLLPAGKGRDVPARMLRVSFIRSESYPVREAGQVFARC